MAKQWRCAVVGTGMVGEWHVRTIPKIPSARLVAICEIQPDRARMVLEKNNIAPVPLYESLGDMLRKEQLDVIHICTPSGDHLTPAMTAMQAGKNVVTEKPMEIQLDRIDKMIENAKTCGVRLAGIFQNRWNPANRALHDAMAEGRFGRLAWAGCFTPWYRTDQYYSDGGWRGTWKLDGGGAVMNQSVHAIDLLQWIVGPVKSVSAYASSRIHAKIEVEDTLSAAIQFANGGYGTIMGTTAMYPGSPVRIEVGGENGTAVSENGLRVFKFRDERTSDKQLIETINAKKPQSSGGGTSAADVPQDFHFKNISHIFESWDAGRDAETSGPEARKAVAIVLAMYESARKGGAAVEVK